ncbi:hypothetical protein Tco_1286915, partial [Tanacetum coccineum]
LHGDKYQVAKVIREQPLNKQHHNTRSSPANNPAQPAAAWWRDVPGGSAREALHELHTMSNHTASWPLLILKPTNVDVSFTPSSLIKGAAKGSFVNEGFTDWTHLGTRLKEHEVGLEHITNMATWFDMRRRLEKNETLDKVAHEQFEIERYH